MCSHSCTPTITTPRLRLRPMRHSDATAIAHYAGEPDVARMTTRMPHPYDLKDAQGFIEAVAMTGEERVFAIADQADSLIGALGFHALDRHGAPEIGYWLGKPYWGQGLATEAVSATLVWAHRDWGRKVVRAGHFADNEASGAVLVKSDFLYTGEVQKRSSVARGGEIAPTRMMVWIA
jgi:RimJ/RimL family protein N-acetyltransferase